MVLANRLDNGNGRGATLEEVARVAGVSRATVSRVVNGNPRVNPDVRRAVERAVDRLGYVPNPAAGRLFEDPFFPRLLRGIGAALSSRDLQLILLMPQSSGEETRAERYRTAGHVDGALLASLHGNDPLPTSVAARGLPVVVGGRPPRGAPVSYVDVDNVQGAQSAIEHLIAGGRRRIATIAGPQDMAAGADRLTGYHDALEAAGIARDAQLVSDGDFTQQGG